MHSLVPILNQQIEQLSISWTLSNPIFPSLHFAKWAGIIMRKQGPEREREHKTEYDPRAVPQAYF